MMQNCLRCYAGVVIIALTCRCNSVSHRLPVLYSFTRSPLCVLSFRFPIMFGYAPKLVSTVGAIRQSGNAVLKKKKHCIFCNYVMVPL